jgi:hypothetical protein
MKDSKVKKLIMESVYSYSPELVGIFGSYSRKENTGKSDIDILIRFKKGLSLLQLIKLENELSEKLGIKVDLITEGAIKNKRIRENIEKDLDIIYKA